MTAATQLCRLLGIQVPIIQDGMGPYRTARLAAAVSSAGGLGTVSMPGMTAEPETGARLLREAIEETASLTHGPFSVNVPVGVGPGGEVLPVTETYIAEVIRAREQDPALSTRLVALTTSAGFPGSYTARIHDAGLLHLHKVGAVHHARKAAANGSDVIIASGFEMGGHTHEHPVHTMVLAPQVIDAVAGPVVVSGGIYDGRGLAAVLAMGGAGVAMGTRFIATVENEWDDAFKRRVLEAGEWEDVVFPGVYGPIRGLPSAGVDELKDLWGKLGDDALTAWKDERMIAAQREGDVEHGLLPAGQCAAAIHDIPTVADLFAAMVTRARELLQAAAQEELPVAAG